MLFVFNFTAYKEAEAAATTVNETFLEATFVGAMLVVATLGAAATDSHEWLQEKKEVLISDAKETWGTLSTHAKENFALSVSQVENGILATGSWLSEAYDTFSDYFMATENTVAKLNTQNANIGLLSITIPNNGFVQITRASDNRVFEFRGVATFSWYSTHVKVLSSSQSVDFKPKSSIYNYDDFIGITSPFSLINRLINYYSDISSISIVAGDGTVINSLYNPLDNYLRDQAIPNGQLDNIRVPSPVPLTLDGTKLNQLPTGDLVLPDGTPYTGELADVVWTPSPTNVIDVGGVPTAVTQTPTGDWVNSLTGDVVVPADPVIPDTTTDGTLGGFFSKLWEWLKSILQAILGLPAAIISALAGLLASLFVPSEGYWNNQMDKLKRLLWGDQAEDMTDQIEGMKDVSSNQFKDVYVNLMGVSNLKIIDASVVNGVLSSVHSWVRGVFYALLVFFNTNQLYKLIRGTSLMESYRERRSGD